MGRMMYDVILCCRLTDEQIRNQKLICGCPGSAAVPCYTPVSSDAPFRFGSQLADEDGNRACSPCTILKK